MSTSLRGNSDAHLCGVRPDADPGAWCWATTGHWDAALESIQDARIVPSAGAARARYAGDTGEHFIDVAVWHRYARACDLQEQWESYCESLGWMEPDPDGEDGAEREMPDTPPEGWTPDPWNEEIYFWSFCNAEDDGAVPVWVCGPRSERGPHRPGRAS